MSIVKVQSLISDTNVDPTASLTQNGPAKILADFFWDRLQESNATSYIDGVDAAVLGGQHLTLSLPKLPNANNSAQNYTRTPCADLVLRINGRHLITFLHFYGTSPCTNCLDLRLMALLSSAEQHSFEHGGFIPRMGSTPYLTPAALEHTWAVVCQLAAAPAVEAMKHRGVLAFDLFAGAVERHGLLANSLCLRCYPTRSDDVEQSFISSSGTLTPRDGTTRVSAIHEYSIDREQFVNPICGAIGKRGVQKNKHSLTAPVVGAFFDTDERHELIVWSGHRNCFRDSFLVGVLEGLERQAGLKCRTQKRPIVASYRELGNEALDPALLGLAQENCYPTSSHVVLYTPDLRCNWVWGYSLATQKPILVPQQMVYYGSLDEGDVRFMEHCSSGCAAGGSFEEAILNAILELIERDAFVISWYAKLRLPRIDQSDYLDPHTRHIVNKLQYLGWDLDILDARLDIRIPTVIAVARRRDRELGSLLLAAGCNIYPAEAIRAALSEVAAYVVGFQETVTKDESKARKLMADYTLVKTIHDHSLVYGLPEMADLMADFYLGGITKSYSDTYHDLPQPMSPRTLSSLIHFCISEMRNRRLEEVVVVDQTSREQDAIGAKTVCMIIPGLAPIEFGYGRKRATTVPRMKTAPVRAGYAGPKEWNILPHPFP